jgi:hypothetical protein
MMVAKLFLDLISPLMGCVKYTYRWKLPAEIPIPFDRSHHPYYDALALRRAMHDEWCREPDRRLELATWYVRRWGGVKKTSDETLSEYVVELQHDKLPHKLQRVASWSKIASIARPDQYFIYDARVAVTLNALQFLKYRDIRHRFALPDSQNTIIRSTIPRLAELGVSKVASSSTIDSYQMYLEALSGFGAASQQAEMALFAAAPTIAHDFLQLLETGRPPE